MTKTWINTQTRQPPEPGWYTVRCLKEESPWLAFWSGACWLNDAGARVVFGMAPRNADEWLEGSQVRSADLFQDGRKAGLEEGGNILNGIAAQLFKEAEGQKDAKARGKREAARRLTLAAITLRAEAMRPAMEAAMANVKCSRTGRFDSKGPNLQNIPIRTEEGARIRNLFTNKKKP